MKTVNEWFDEYAVSHQNKTNQLIHYICVPAIVFSLVGMLMCIPTSLLTNFFGFSYPYIVHWATVAIMLSLFFYIRLSFDIFLKMLIFSAICIALNYLLGLYLPLLYTSLAIFVVAWIGQFYGHKIEGKKPSFFEDLQFLLIGPVWIIKKLLS